MQIHVTSQAVDAVSPAPTAATLEVVSTNENTPLQQQHGHNSSLQQQQVPVSGGLNKDLAPSTLQQLQQQQQVTGRAVSPLRATAATAAAAAARGVNSHSPHSATSLAASRLAALFKASTSNSQQQQQPGVKPAVLAAGGGAVAGPAAVASVPARTVVANYNAQQPTSLVLQQQPEVVVKGVTSPEAAAAAVGHVPARQVAGYGCQIKASIVAAAAAAGSPAPSDAAAVPTEKQPSPAADSATAQSTPTTAPAAVAVDACPLPAGYQLPDYADISDAEDYLCDLLSADNLHGPDEQLEKLQDAVATLSSLQEGHEKLTRFKKDYKWVQEWVKRRKAVKIGTAVDKMLDNALKQE